MARLNGHTSAITGLAFAPDGRTLASCSADQFIRLWNLEENAEIRRYQGTLARFGQSVFQPMAGGSSVADATAPSVAGTRLIVPRRTGLQFCLSAAAPWLSLGIAGHSPQ
jgi:WD40 repeat protein